MDDRTTLNAARALGHVLNGNPDRARELMAPLDAIDRIDVATALADLSAIVTGTPQSSPVFSANVM